MQALTNSLGSLPPFHNPLSDFHCLLNRPTLERVSEELGHGTEAATVRFCVGFVKNTGKETVKLLAENPWLSSMLPEVIGLLRKIHEDRTGALPRVGLKTPQDPPVAQEPPKEPEVAQGFPGEPEAEREARAEIVEEFGEVPPAIEELLLTPEPVKGFAPLCAPVYYDRKRAKKALQRARKAEPGFGLGTIAQRVSAAVLVLCSVLPSYKALDTLLFDAEPPPAHVELVPDLEAARLELLALRELDERHQE